MELLASDVREFQNEVRNTEGGDRGLGKREGEIPFVTGLTWFMPQVQGLQFFLLVVTGLFFVDFVHA